MHEAVNTLKGEDNAQEVRLANLGGVRLPRGPAIGPGRWPRSSMAIGSVPRQVERVCRRLGAHMRSARAAFAGTRALACVRAHGRMGAPGGPSAQRRLQRAVSCLCFMRWPLVCIVYPIASLVAHVGRRHAATWYRGPGSRAAVWMSSVWVVLQGAQLQSSFPQGGEQVGSSDASPRVSHSRRGAAHLAPRPLRVKPCEALPPAVRKMGCLPDRLLSSRVSSTTPCRFFDPLGPNPLLVPLHLLCPLHGFALQPCDQGLGNRLRRPLRCGAIDPTSACSAAPIYARLCDHPRSERFGRLSHHLHPCCASQGGPLRSRPQNRVSCSA